MHCSLELTSGRYGLKPVNTHFKNATLFTYSEFGCLRKRYKMATLVMIPYNRMYNIARSISVELVQLDDHLFSFGLSLESVENVLIRSHED